MAKTQVRPTSKGQVTLPISIRKQLNIGPETLLDVSVENEKIVLRSINLDQIDDQTRIYSSEEIEEFLGADKLSAENAIFFKKLFKKL